jgi:hypothetical protein
MFTAIRGALCAILLLLFTALVPASVFAQTQPSADQAIAKSGPGIVRLTLNDGSQQVYTEVSYWYWEETEWGTELVLVFNDGTKERKWAGAVVDVEIL